VALVGGLSASVTLSAFAYEWYTGSGLARARDATFSVLVIGELLRAFGARSDARTIWQIGVLSNMRLALVVLGSIAMQVAIHHVAALQVLFGTSPVALWQWVAWLALGSVPLLVLEVRKVVSHLYRQPRDAAGQRPTIVSN
jgi:Ca2+-transporting ATPase